MRQSLEEKWTLNLKSYESMATLMTLILKFPSVPSKPKFGHTGRGLDAQLFEREMSHVYNLVFEQLVPNWRFGTFMRWRFTEASTSLCDGYEGL